MEEFQSRGKKQEDEGGDKAEEWMEKIREKDGMEWKREEEMKQQEEEARVCEDNYVKKGKRESKNNNRQNDEGQIKRYIEKENKVNEN